MMRSRFVFKTINFFSACLQSAYQELWTHKLRSFLSVLGITLGILSFMTLKMLGDWQTRETEAFIAEIGGHHQVIVEGRQPLDGKDAYDMARSPGLRFSDLDSLKAQVPGIRSLSKLLLSFKVTFGMRNEEYLCCVAGVSPDFMNRHRMDYGRDIFPGEYDHGSDVALMTFPLFKKLQKEQGVTEQKLLGRRIYLSLGIAPKIVGVFSKEKVGTEWPIYKYGIFMPLKYYEKNISGNNIRTDGLYLGLTADADTTTAKENIRQKLVRLHRGVTDFTFRTADWVSNMQGTIEKVRLTFFIITLLSLLVGGLNIMNVMLTSVSARVREIGIRSAIGASPVQIFLQFLFEACFLSLMGGGVGLLMGAFLIPAGFALAAPGATPGPLMIYILQGGAVSVLVGLVFGLFPALRAFRMRPVTALHYE